MSFFSLFLIAFYVNNCAKLIKSSDSTLIWKRFLQETWYFMAQAQSYNPSFHFQGSRTPFIRGHEHPSSRVTNTLYQGSRIPFIKGHEHPSSRVTNTLRQGSRTPFIKGHEYPSSRVTNTLRQGSRTPFVKGHEHIK